MNIERIKYIQELNLQYEDGSKWIRTEQVGCGEAGRQLILNNFKIIGRGHRTITVMGTMASGVKKCRKINLQDFPLFVKKIHKNHII